MRRWLQIAAVSTVLLASCHEPVTEIVVVTDADASLRSQLTEVRFEVVGADSMTQSTHITARSGAPLPWPLSLGLVPHGSSLGPVTVTVRGLVSGTERISRAGTVSFVSGQVRMLRLDLRTQCVDAGCVNGQTCTEQGCQSPTSARLTAWPGHATPLPEAGPPRDAGPPHGDAGPREGGMRDSGCLTTEDPNFGGSCNNHVDDDCDGRTDCDDPDCAWTGGCASQWPCTEGQAIGPCNTSSVTGGCYVCESGHYLMDCLPSSDLRCASFDAGAGDGGTMDAGTGACPRGATSDGGVCHPRVTQLAYFYGSGSDSVDDLAVDSSGNVYAVGVTRDMTMMNLVDLEGGVHHVATRPGANVFVARFNSAGDLAWVHTIGSMSGNETDPAITLSATDPQRVVVIGRTTSTSALVLESGTPLPASGLPTGDEVFAVAFNTSATTMVWASYYPIPTPSGGPPTTTPLRGLSADSNSAYLFEGSWLYQVALADGTIVRMLSYGSVVGGGVAARGGDLAMAGWFDAATSFGCATILPSGGGASAFGVEVAPSGVCSMSHALFSGAWPTDVASAAVGDNYLVAGGYQSPSSLPASAGGTDTFVASFSRGWSSPSTVVTFGSDQEDEATAVVGQSVGGADAAVVTGYFGGRTCFDPSGALPLRGTAHCLSPTGTSDAFVARYNRIDLMVPGLDWAAVIGENDKAHAVGTGPAPGNDLWVGGVFNGMVDFGTGAVGSPGIDEGFLVHLVP